jgi:molybdopterin-containing oxidoreductase family iron-sulfur binding subunit
MSEAAKPVDLDDVRQQLGHVQGPQYWRTLEELAQTEGFRALLAQKMPSALALLEEGIDRRKFLGLLGASLALAGVTGCSQAPVERINPYVRAPEEIVPGRPLYFATAMPVAGYASGGLLVESHMGRPTKVEGNPEHPASPLPRIAPRRSQFGPSDTYAQASLLSLYDPDRSQSPQHLGDIAAWGAFRRALTEALRRKPEGELRLRILTGTVTSPSLAALIARILSRYSQARWCQWEPVGNWNALAGAHLAFNRHVETHYRFEDADRILALDCDFLGCRTGPLRYARDFGDRRRVWDQGPSPEMNRLYVVETMPTGTGAKADHRVALRRAQVEAFVRAVASRLGVAVGQAAGDEAFGLAAGWIAALARDFQQYRGRSIVLAGEGQPPVVHALAHAMNDRIGNFGHTVFHTEPVAVAAPESAQQGSAARYDHVASLRQLVTEMNDGGVDILLILGGNPVYTAPADLGFAEAMHRMRDRGLLVHLGPYFDETSARCHWHLNEAHYLESWGDVRGHDGTVSLIQPLIAPLYQGRTAQELLSVFTSMSGLTGLEILQLHWRRVFANAPEVREERRSYANLRPGGDFDSWWRRCVHDGYIPGTEAASVGGLAVQAGGFAPAEGTAAGQGLEIVYRPDPAVFDGCFANNGWLQELPRPLSKITWDNVATISPRTAVDLGLAPSIAQAERANGKEVTLTLQGRDVAAPVWVLPGHADGSVTVTLGYGRRRAGRVGNGVGFDAYRLRTSAAPWFATGLQVRPTGRQRTVVTTHGHHLMPNHDQPLTSIPARISELVRSGDVEDFATIAREQRERGANRPRNTISLYPPRDFSEGHEWGMAIDLNACTGCQACVVACQSENNIPVVGKEQVAAGREMHWLRIDTYYRGDPQRPQSLETYFQPLPCMHCETAPCELVCPVEATVHSADGLNDMVYNRCVGTRYCSNNCPYKVRRFNFLQYSDFADEHQRLMRNPDVTVRSRGVMEKCTYCVQRIREVEITARREGTHGRPIEDGEIQTACQAACPVGAIVFGDLNVRGGRPPSKVRQMQEHDLNYGLLTDLNTRPRTTYLWAFKNPNPDIARLEGSRPAGG